MACSCEALSSEFITQNCQYSVACICVCVCVVVVVVVVVVVLFGYCCFLFGWLIACLFVCFNSSVACFAARNSRVFVEAYALYDRLNNK